MYCMYVCMHVQKRALHQPMYLQRGPPIPENEATTHRTHRTHRTLDPRSHGTRRRQRILKFIFIGTEKYSEHIIIVYTHAHTLTHAHRGSISISLHATTVLFVQDQFFYLLVVFGSDGRNLGDSFSVSRVGFVSRIRHQGVVHFPLFRHDLVL